MEDNGPGLQPVEFYAVDSLADLRRFHIFIRLKGSAIYLLRWGVIPASRSWCRTPQALSHPATQSLQANAPPPATAHDKHSAMIVIFRSQSIQISAWCHARINS